MSHRVSRCKRSCVNSADLLLVGVSSVALLQPANREEALHATCRPLQTSKAQQTAQFLMRAGFAGHSFWWQQKWFDSQHMGPVRV
jgi:hypothetical protein